MPFTEVARGQVETGLPVALLHSLAVGVPAGVVPVDMPDPPLSPGGQLGREQLDVPVGAVRAAEGERGALPWRLGNPASDQVCGVVDAGELRVTHGVLMNADLERGEFAAAFPSLRPGRLIRVRMRLFPPP